MINDLWPSGHQSLWSITYYHQVTSLYDQWPITIRSPVLWSMTYHHQVTTAFMINDLAPSGHHGLYNQSTILIRSPQSSWSRTYHHQVTSLYDQGSITIRSPQSSWWMTYHHQPLECRSTLVFWLVRCWGLLLCDGSSADHILAHPCATTTSLLAKHSSYVMMLIVGSWPTSVMVVALFVIYSTHFRLCDSSSVGYSSQHTVQTDRICCSSAGPLPVFCCSSALPLLAHCWVLDVPLLFLSYSAAGPQLVLCCSSAGPPLVLSWSTAVSLLVPCWSTASPPLCDKSSFGYSQHSFDR